jgi:hypothetical protein
LIGVSLVTSFRERSLRLASLSWLAGGVALLGGIVYFYQSWLYAHMQVSLLDEGAYLLKGYLYATGKYWPYQDYGPWANHMPLVFLVPGWVQVLFGPGLRTGRYLSVLFSLLLVAGVWLLVRRLAGRWWAALGVWALALNPALIKMFSLANSQAFLASMLVWVLALALGEKRARWQIGLGSFLAGLMVITRINLSFVLPCLVLYLAWEYGWRTGLWAATFGLAPVIVGHAVFWPNILRVWAHWVPLGLAPFIKPWANPVGSAPSWNPIVDTATRWLSFFQGFRFHFTALVGAVSAWLLWPQRTSWKSSGQLRMAFFLSVLLGIMTIFHIGAALGKDYCVFCYPVYLSFFSTIGLILVAITLPVWASNLSRLRQAVVFIVLLGITAGTGFGTSNNLGRVVVSDTFVRDLLNLQVPRMSAFHLMNGSVPIWGLLANRLELTFSQVVQSTSVFLRAWVPALLGLLGGIALWLAAWLAARWFPQNRGQHRFSRGWLALVGLLSVGLILSPTTILGGGFDTYDCSGDVIRSYEAAGERLAQVIPPGSLVYWAGGDSTVPLLYVPDVRIFPAQINGDYSYRLGGEPDALARYGFWSEPLARQWASQADYILIEARLYQGWLRDWVESGAYHELAPTPPVSSCYHNAEIHIYRRDR